MKVSFSLKLAKDNILNNRRLYIPFILSTSGIIALLYIVNSLAQNESIAMSYGGGYINSFLSIGTSIITIFAFIFLFYTNSFISKRRKSEYGLYNVLGLSKVDSVKVLAGELFISYIISLVSGIIIGILFEKLAFLLILKILNVEVIFGFSINIISIIGTVICFTIIFILLFVYSAISILKNNPIKLLKEKEAGEKEPKGKWLITILGIICMGSGYYLANIVSSPLDSLAIFFPAVILVIFGTYLLFTSGSIALLHFLKKREKYYYKTNHFIVVSNMMYRMKKNATGLASICIMSTMILVMIASTTSLWFSLEKNTKMQFPRDFKIEVYNENYDDDKNVLAIEKVFADYDIKTSDYLIFNSLLLTGEFNDNNLSVNGSGYTNNSQRDINFMAVDEFNKIVNDNYSLENDEIIFVNENKRYNYPNLSINNKDYKIKEYLTNNYLEVPDSNYINNDGEYIIVFTNEVYDDFKATFDTVDKRFYMFNIDSSLYEKTGSSNPLELNDKLYKNIESEYMRINSAEDLNVTLKGMFGAFLFLGIFLGLTFMISIVLIIYYKQVSEGDEDASQYSIMRKVGLSDKEIKKTIHTQIIFVFFAPLVVAIIHLIGSYSLISKLLIALSQFNGDMYIYTCIACTIIFVIFYSIVYILTSKTYYKTIMDKS